MVKNPPIRSKLLKVVPGLGEQGRAEQQRGPGVAPHAAVVSEKFVGYSDFYQTEIRAGGTLISLPDSEIRAGGL